MPDTRKRMGSKAAHVNVYPFVWNDFRKYGYVTGTETEIVHYAGRFDLIVNFRTLCVQHLWKICQVRAYLRID